MLGLGEDRLSIYLNDHLAGATAGVSLARRAAGKAIAEEIEEDRQALLDVMERLSVGQDRLKLAIAWGAEKAARLKPNGDLRGSSPLGRLEELEALSLGVEAKIALWRTLRHALASDPRLEGVDLDALITRAQSQRRRLERQRMSAAEAALL
jgi:hypothetical protein